MHVHLGLYGKLRRCTTATPPPPVGQVRLRLVAGRDAAPSYGDLRGATACELLTAAQRRRDPRPARPRPAARRTPTGPGPGTGSRRSRAPIGGLLMDQAVLAGVGNVYRAEVLFRHRVDPLRPGRTLRRSQFELDVGRPGGADADGVRTGRIDTVHVDHTPEAMGRPPRGRRPRGRGLRLPARRPALLRVRQPRCAPRSWPGRNLFWCPRCQPTFRSRAARLSRRDGRAEPHRGTPGASAATRVGPMVATPRTPAALTGAVRRPGARAVAGTAPSAGCASPTWSPALLLGAACVLIGIAQYVVPVRAAHHAGASRWSSATWCSAPRTLPWVVVFALGVLVVVVAATPEPARRPPHRRRRGDLPDRPDHPGLVVPADPASASPACAGESMLVDLRDRIHNQAQDARPARRTGTPRRCCARRAARRSPGTSWSRPGPTTAPRSRWPSSTSPARASRPGPARCCCPARSAGCSARSPAERVPARRQRLPAPPGLERGLRHRRARAHRPGRPAPSSSARPATRRRYSCTPGPGAGRCTRPRGRCSG